MDQYCGGWGWAAVLETEGKEHLDTLSHSPKDFISLSMVRSASWRLILCNGGRRRIVSTVRKREGGRERERGSRDEIGRKLGDALEQQMGDCGDGIQ